jgi:hypothetical protein
MRWSGRWFCWISYDILVFDSKCFVFRLTAIFLVVIGVIPLLLVDKYVKVELEAGISPNQK